MAFLLTSTQHGLLLLLLVGGSACQRASYTCQRLATLPVPAAPQARVSSLAAALDTSKPAVALRVAPVASPPRRHRQRRSWVVAQAQPRAGQLAPASHIRVKQVLVVCSPAAQPVHMRSRGLALLLAVLLMPLGVYHFYLGYHVRGVVSLLLAGLAVILYILGILTFVLGNGIYAALIAGLVIQVGLTLWQLSDIVRIIINTLKPKAGEYYPRFFQARPSSTTTSVCAGGRSSGADLGGATQLITRSCAVSCD